MEAGSGVCRSVPQLVGASKFNRGVESVLKLKPNRHRLLVVQVTVKATLLGGKTFPENVGKTF